MTYVMKKDLIKRLTSYVKVDTQSDFASDTVPSTPGQLTLAKQLYEELNEMGMSDITIDDNGYVMATLPANTKADIPTIGFLAHLDTATELTGKNVNPQVIENYDGNDITLNKAKNIILSVDEFPELPTYK